MPCHIGPYKKALGSVRKQREQEENCGQGFYCGFHKEKQVRHNKQA